MAYQVRKTTSYGGRLSNSLKGIGLGFLMFIIGTVVLFWNEGNFVKTNKSIQEAEGVVVTDYRLCVVILSTADRSLATGSSHSRNLVPEKKGKREEIIN